MFSQKSVTLALAAAAIAACTSVNAQSAIVTTNDNDYAKAYGKKKDIYEPTLCLGGSRVLYSDYDHYHFTEVIEPFTTDKTELVFHLHDVHLAKFQSLNVNVSVVYAVLHDPSTDEFASIMYDFEGASGATDIDSMILLQSSDMDVSETDASSSENFEFQFIDFCPYSLKTKAKDITDSSSDDSSSSESSDSSSASSSSSSASSDSSSGSSSGSSN